MVDGQTNSIEFVCLSSTMNVSINITRRFHIMVHDDSTMGSIGLAIGSPSGKQNMIAMLTNPMLTDEGFGLKYQCNKLCSLAPYAD